MHRWCVVRQRSGPISFVAAPPLLPRNCSRVRARLFRAPPLATGASVTWSRMHVKWLLASHLCIHCTLPVRGLARPSGCLVPYLGEGAPPPFPNVALPCLYTLSAPLRGRVGAEVLTFATPAVFAPGRPCPGVAANLCTRWAGGALIATSRPPDHGDKSNGASIQPPSSSLPHIVGASGPQLGQRAWRRGSRTMRLARSPMQVLRQLPLPACGGCCLAVQVSCACRWPAASTKRPLLPKRPPEPPPPIAGVALCKEAGRPNQ